MILIKNIRAVHKDTWLEMILPLLEEQMKEASSPKTADELKEEYEDIEGRAKSLSCFAAFKEMEIIGMITSYVLLDEKDGSTHATGYSRDWYVKEPYRKRGVGDNLLESALVQLEEIDKVSSTVADVPASPRYLLNSCTGRHGFSMTGYRLVKPNGRIG